MKRRRDKLPPHDKHVGECIIAALHCSGIFGTREREGSMAYRYQQWLEAAIKAQIKAGKLAEAK